LGNSVYANAPRWSDGCDGLPKTIADSKIYDDKEFACRKIDFDGDNREDIIITVRNEGVSAYKCVGRLISGEYAYTHMPLDFDYERTKHLWYDKVSVD
ncbi:hypothetical protein HN843_06865, partial [bacterium]|nr:hypothetical protein [bacterium]